MVLAFSSWATPRFFSVFCRQVRSPLCWDPFESSFSFADKGFCFGKEAVMLLATPSLHPSSGTSLPPLHKRLLQLPEVSYPACPSLGRHPASPSASGKASFQPPDPSWMPPSDMLQFLRGFPKRRHGEVGAVLVCLFIKCGGCQPF